MACTPGAPAGPALVPGVTQQGTRRFAWRLSPTGRGAPAPPTEVLTDRPGGDGSCPSHRLAGPCVSHPARCCRRPPVSCGPRGGLPGPRVLAVGSGPQPSPLCAWWPRRPHRSAAGRGPLPSGLWTGRLLVSEAPGPSRRLVPWTFRDRSADPCAPVPQEGTSDGRDLLSGTCSWS